MTMAVTRTKGVITTRTGIANVAFAFVIANTLALLSAVTHPSTRRNRTIQASPSNLALTNSSGDTLPMRLVTLGELKAVMFFTHVTNITFPADTFSCEGIAIAILAFGTNGAHVFDAAIRSLPRE